MDLFNSWLVNKYIAHRGFHDEQSPENSLSSFSKAIEHDFAIELDVHVIEDGTPVVFHDETLKRMTGQDGYIKQVKNIEELKKLKLGNSNETIPTLQETLNLINGKTPIIIEIKDFKVNSYYEKSVYELLKKYNGEYAVMSFNPYTLKWFKENAPEVIRGQLSCFFKGSKLSLIKKYILKRMKLNKKVSEPHFIAYKWDELPNRFVKKYNNIPLLAWAVPNQQSYMKIAKHCDNIIFENFEPRI